MKLSNLLLSSFLFFFLINLEAQSRYVQGYYINNENSKRIGYIKNIDWNRNPTSFQFKTKVDGLVEKIDINQAKEFGADSLFKYIRTKIDLDISSTTAKNISVQREPEYEKKTVFLKVLVEGTYVLYEFKDDRFRKFFYNKPNNNRKRVVYESEDDKYKEYTSTHIGKNVVIPLINKKYSLNGKSILENNDYKEQLYQLSNSKLLTLEEVRKTEYNRQSLSKAIVKINEDSDKESVINYTSNSQNVMFRIHIRPGLNLSSLDIIDTGVEESSIDRNFSLDTQLSFRLGAQFEMILPFNNNKWAITLEPTYQSYSGSARKNGTPNSAFERAIVANADISSIEISSALRYYMHLNDNTSLFLNAGLTFDLWLKQELAIVSDNNANVGGFDFGKINSGVPFYGGLGMIYKKKFGFEINYQTRQDLVSFFTDKSTDYMTLSFVFSYRLL